MSTAQVPISLIRLYKLSLRRSGRKLTNTDGESLLHLAEQLVRDNHSKTGSDFLNKMVDVLAERGKLTPAQSRAVLNTVLANIRARHNYYQSREYRSDLGTSDFDCILCGAPLDDAVSAARGAGPTCYKRVLGDKS